MAAVRYIVNDVDAAIEIARPLRGRFGDVTRRDIETGAAPRLDVTRSNEAIVGFHDREAADALLRRQRAYGRQTRTRPQQTRIDVLSHPDDQLLDQRIAAARRELQVQHGGLVLRP